MYTTKTTIEKYLGVSLDSSLDTFITLTINSVKDFIEKYCGDEKFGKRVFEAPTLGEGEEESDVVKYFDGNDEQRLYIGDLKSITSLVVDSVAQTLNEDYFLKPYNALAEGKPYDSIELAQPDGRHGSRGKAIYVFDAVQRNVIITGKWRYSDTAPADIQLIATKLVASILKEKVGDITLREVKSETLDDYRVDYTDIRNQAQTIGALDILNQYKRKSPFKKTGIIMLD